MPNDLTTSDIERQNILNNPYAVDEIAKAVSIETIEFRGKRVLLKEQVAAFFEVTIRTIETYLAANAAELAQNGYEVLRGKSLKDLKIVLSELDVTEIDFGNIGKAPQPGIFDFRAFLNIAIDTINRKNGGGRTYINQRGDNNQYSNTRTVESALAD